ncbi:hypothetical protein XM38_006890 [Halomicronema hongdechloris C2206]|uniref:Uncharacterized protein n=2 Tax=Halomicronema hongdechloris TaxID=1209493 RepID=A0A1Z3HHK8_9CYAN|nr:hypothetical protein XM38_006890 [Halomicronema hongdechloris C2206]
MVGELLARWWRSLSHRLPDAIAAIAARTPQPHGRLPHPYDDRSQLLGWLLQPCWPLIQAQPETEILTALQQQVSLLGHGSCSRLIECHLGVAPALQHDLLRRLLTEPVPRYEDIKTALAQWIASLLPAHLEVADFPLGDRWEAFLYESWPPGWQIVLTLAVAHWAGRDQGLFNAILADGLFGPTHHLGANLMVLRESVMLGAAEWIAPYLASLPPDCAQTMNFAFLAKGLPAGAVKHMSPAGQEAIAQWLSPHVPDQAVTLWTLINHLADAAPTARELLIALVPQLPKKTRRQVEVQLLRFQPIAAHPPLETLSKSDQRFLLAMYQEWAQQDEAALERLLATARGKQNDAAVSASRVLADLDSGPVSLEDWVPLVRSRFVGVRVNALTAMATQLAKQSVADATLKDIAIALATEDNPTVGRKFCDLVAEWVRRRHRVPPVVSRCYLLPANKRLVGDARVSRERRPYAELYPFSMRDAMPRFAVPLTLQS